MVPIRPVFVPMVPVRSVPVAAAPVHIVVLSAEVASHMKSAPAAAMNRLFTGDNMGKLLIRLADPR